jgi:hypothetical protein
MLVPSMFSGSNGKRKEVAQHPHWTDKTKQKEHFVSRSCVRQVHPQQPYDTPSFPMLANATRSHAQALTVSSYLA